MNRTRAKELWAARGANLSEWRLLPYIFSALYHLLRLGLASIFIYAGFVKLLNSKAFAHALAQFQLIPDGFLPAVTIGLPAAELLAGLGLIFDRRISLTIILSMLIGFIMILGYAILNDLDIDCGCFTLDELTERTSVKGAIFRDLFMVAAVFFLFWCRRFRTQVHSRKFFKSKLTQGKEE
jgi:uncharacterized membrane protein YphA (DoxX/SURF4 family)